MKLKEALKKFSFLKRLSLPDKIIERAANHLARTLVGDKEKYITPLAKRIPPIELLVDWDEIVDANMHKLNCPLKDLELSNRSKFGPRSISTPWSERVASIVSSFNHQSDKHLPIFRFIPGPGNLCPISIKEAASLMKLSSSSGFPWLASKGKCLKDLLKDFDDMLARKDPCIVYTRTTEKKKTRNVWGYPFADTLFEMMFYFPLLAHQRLLNYRAALVSPDAVAQRISEIIKEAIRTGRLLYSVDFAGFDNSIKYQYIIAAFDYIKSCFAPGFHPYLDYVCERMYSISIVTPTGIYRGKHGVPSGSGFTNEVDSIVQLGIACTCSFIKIALCVIQGDDGVYTLFENEIPEFEAAFHYAGLKLEKSKSVIAKNYVIFCQNLYHIDYIDDNGHIGGIYPTYRALNRLLFQERFVDFSRIGIKGADYYGIRALTILENCKYHPLFEELVRFVLAKEKFSLDISDDGLVKYCEYLNMNRSTINGLNHQYGSQVMGIRKFEAYKMVTKILAEEELIS